MLEVALIIGISYAEFWQLTPYEIEIAKKAYNKRQIEKYNSNVILANQTAFFSMSQKLKWNEWQNYIIKDNKNEQQIEMTDEQLLNQIKTLNAVLGGSVENVNG